MDEELKREWEQKIRQSYADGDALIRFMRETVDNFAYRYISTGPNPTPKAEFQGEKLLEVRTFEDSMVNALKISHPEAKNGIKELAKAVPKAQRPTVLYALGVEIHELKPDHGKVVVRARVNWSFPEHGLKSGQQVVSSKTFTWDDLQVFRKEFPLALQEVAELFL